MGVLLQCPLCCPCHSKQQQQSKSQLQSVQSEASTSSSLSSQPSLPSVPSLSHQPHQSTHHHHQLLATIKAHSAPISSLSLHAKLLFTASSNGQIIASPRDPSTPHTHSLVATSTAPIKALLPLHHKLLTAHQDHKIRVWKTLNPNQPHLKCIATLPTLPDRFSKLFSSKNYVPVRRHKKCTWVHHVDAVSALALSKDANFFYSASWDRTFKLWRASDFRCLESVNNAHDDAINALVVSNDGVVYTGSADRKIKAWKKREGEKKHSLMATLEKHKSAVNALALSEDGSVLYSGACDRSILVWESDVGGEGVVLVGALRGHTKAILCLVALGDLVCSGSADNSVRVWRRGVGKSDYSCLAVLEGHSRPVKCLAMAVDDADADAEKNTTTTTPFLVYSAGLDCDIKVWTIRVPLF